MVTYILYGLFILACIVLVVSVLLQPGKADAGALFTSSISSTAFGPRGTQTVLARITMGAAATFMIVALLLSMGIGSGESSIMSGSSKAKATPTPAASPAQQAAPQGQASPAATQTNEGGAAAPAANTNAATAPAASPATK